MLRRMTALTALLTLAISASAFLIHAQQKAAPANKAASTAAPTPVTGDPVVTKSGLKYWDIKVGDGAEAVRGKTVRVHYTGWLTNGKKFDSSVGGKPFEFRLGAGDVIRGWDEGVAGMKVGGKRQLNIKPELGYGAQGYPPVIPPRSTLVFDVELLAVR